jgi:hypothetical protein
VEILKDLMPETALPCRDRFALPPPIENRSGYLTA